MSRQWETWMTRGDEQDPHGHPLIVLSNDESCADANRASVNVLLDQRSDQPLAIALLKLSATKRMVSTDRQ